MINLNPFKRRREPETLQAAAAVQLPTAPVGRTVKFIPVRASFDAASRSPEAMRHFRGADLLAADSALSQDIRMLIASRARYEVTNNGYAHGILLTLAEDTIGTGPRLQYYFCDCTDEAAAEASLVKLQHREARWNQWSKAAQLCRKLKISRFSKAQDGEVFLVKNYNPKLRSHVKLDVTLYESEQVGSPVLSVTPEYYDNGVPKEVDGILYDRYGNPEEYRFWTVHPGANAVGSRLIQDSRMVKAQHVIHYMNQIRPGQHRGVSEIASTLPIFNDLRRFTNAVLAAAETAAEISFVLSTDTPAEDQEGNPQIQHLDAGTVMELCRNAGIALPEGWKASQLKAEQPTATHDNFVTTKIREAARAVSMPLNVALCDSSGYNYASGRLDHQTYHRRINGERAEIEDTILENLREEFEAADRIYFPEDYDVAGEVIHEWMWDGGEHVDPLKEANAQKVRLNDSGTTTLAEECAREGKDWLKVLHQRAREKATRQRLGLDEPTEPAPGAVNPKDDEDDEKE